MTPDSHISRTVMRRVRTIHTIRVIAPVLAASSLFSLALYGIGREVWVAKVLENVRAVSDPTAAISYIASAFLHTDFTVQTLSVLALAAVAWVAVSIMRSLESTQLI